MFVGALMLYGHVCICVYLVLSVGVTNVYTVRRGDFGHPHYFMNIYIFFHKNYLKSCYLSFFMSFVMVCATNNGKQVFYAQEYTVTIFRTENRMTKSAILIEDNSAVNNRFCI